MFTAPDAKRDLFITIMILYRIVLNPVMTIQPFPPRSQTWRVSEKECRFFLFIRFCKIPLIALVSLRITRKKIDFYMGECCFGHEAYSITTGSYKTEHKSNLDIYVTFSKLLYYAFYWNWHAGLYIICDERLHKVLNIENYIHYMEK